MMGAERAGSGRGRAGGPVGEGAAGWRLQDRPHSGVGPGAYATGHCRCADLQDRQRREQQSRIACLLRHASGSAAQLLCELPVAQLAPMTGYCVVC